MVSQRAQTQGFDDMVADIKKALGEGARKNLWWRVRKFFSAALISELTIAGNRPLTGPQKRTPYS